MAIKQKNNAECTQVGQAATKDLEVEVVNEDEERRNDEEHSLPSIGGPTMACSCATTCRHVLSPTPARRRSDMLLGDDDSQLAIHLSLCDTRSHLTGARLPLALCAYKRRCMPSHDHQR